MADKRVVKRSYKESPANQSNFVWEVAFPVAAAAIGAYLIVAAFVSVPAGKGVAGAVMILALLYRLIQWDRYAHGVHSIEHEYFTEPPEPRREIRFVTHDNGDDGNGNRWRIGGWYFSESEWARLATALQAGTVTRDALASVTLDNGNRMFPNITSRYSEYVSKLRQMGWVDADNVVTDAARVWFEERNLARPTDGD